MTRKATTSRSGRGSTDLRQKTYPKLRVFLAALAVALITIAPAASAPSAPDLIGPPDGETVSFLPVFSWNPVSGADKYNFVLAADSAFNSPVYQVLGTKNTRATPDKTKPNGSYWWRVQAVDANGNTSAWSEARSIEKLWADSPTLASPDDAATISFPAEPLVLRWDPVPGAAKYSVEIASDEALSSLVTSGGKSGGHSSDQSRSRDSPSSTTYYWAVTPLDARATRANSPRSVPSRGSGPRRPRRSSRTSGTTPNSTIRSSPGIRCLARRATRSRSTPRPTSRPGPRSAAADKPIATTLTPRKSS